MQYNMANLLEVGKFKTINDVTFHREFSSSIYCRYKGIHGSLTIDNGYYPQEDGRNYLPMLNFWLYNNDSINTQTDIISLEAAAGIVKKAFKMNIKSLHRS